MITLIEELIEKYYPCEEGKSWLKTQPSLKEAWVNCDRGDWLWWILRKVSMPSKEQSVCYADDCAKRAKKYAKTAAAFANAAANAKTAAVAAYAYYAADAAAYGAERKLQADYIRSIISYPE
jgi:hypothetical protein